MRLTYRVEIDCANCARKVEEAINRMDSVEKAQLIYVDKRLVVEIGKEYAERIEEIEAEIDSLARSIESGWRMLSYDDGTPEEEEETDARHLRPRIAIGLVFLAFGLVLEYLLTDLEHDIGNVGLCIIFFIGLMVVGYDVVLGAFRNVVSARFLDENFLMTVATVGALVVSLFGDDGYWTEAVAVMLFYQVGEYYEGKALNRTRRSVKALMELKAPFATVVRPDGIVTVKTETVQVGEMVIIRPGEMVPIDGVVVSGESFVDTKAMTGEPVPRHVGRGDEVLSGYINTESALKIRTLRPYKDSAASKVLSLIEDSAARKSSSERFITKFARYYTPAVVISALALAIIPSLVWPSQWEDWVMKGLIFLVVSCPCALVVSVPLTYFCGIGNASKKGILIKGSNYIEAISQADTAVFDKTGTLTKGEFTVSKVEPVGMTGEELIDIAAHAEVYSNHPIAKSICSHAGVKAGDPGAECRNFPGKGIVTELDGHTVAAGNLVLMEELGLHGIPASEEHGTHVYVAVDGTYAGHILISDDLKEDSIQAVSDLRSLGIRTYMLTGDEEKTARAIADKLGLDGYESELMPGDKTGRLEGFISSSEGSTVFVGDGINDAPSLARADVGIAMGNLGSDAAVEAADVVIIDDMPSKVAESVRISKRTQRIVWQNIAFALGVKFLILLLTTFTDLVSMWVAIFGDVGVLVLAVVNATRALGRRTGHGKHDN